MEKKNIYEKLVSLATIFKQGYTIQFINGSFNQYANINKPYIVSYKILIKITSDTIVIKHLLSANNEIIGYWKDENGTGWIELNKSFSTKAAALKFAKKHNQECIYNFKTGGIINV